MATIKSCTDLSQSKVLAKILPPESADWYYREVSFSFYKVEAEIPRGWYGLPPKGYYCWSLAALLDILPNDWWGYNKHYFLEMSKMGDMSTPYIVSYFRFREQSDGANFGRIAHISFQSDNPVDACYEMILKLHELKML